MVNWNQIIFNDFEDDESVREKLFIHHLTLEEVIQCFYNPFQLRKNKKYKDRYQMIGKTDGGRRLKVIFQLKLKNAVRVITAWDL